MKRIGWLSGRRTSGKRTSGCRSTTALAGTACLMLPLARAAESDLKNPAGTYEVRICKTACLATGDEGVLVKGHVVLFPATLQKHELAQLKAASLRYAQEANACFVLEKLNGRIYAGIQPAGLTKWSIAGDELKFGLYRSADAGYQVAVRATTKGFEGTGKSWGVGAAAPPEPGPEYIMLIRTGESDIKKCEPAVSPAAEAR